MKFGGSVLKDSKDMIRVADIVRNEPEEKVVVVSALKGVTDEISTFLNNLEQGNASPRAIVDSLRQRHLTLLTQTVMDSTRINSIKERLNSLLEHWERVAFGVLYTEELSPRSRDFLLSFGERLAVVLVEGVLRDNGIEARAVETDSAGCVTNGEYGRATVDLEATLERLPGVMKEVLSKDQVPVVTGFFGADESGNTTVFGQGGTDYSAAVIANVLDADLLELWKDVDGFHSSDPKVVDGALHISHLSYDEAAELAYFGANILHPLAIWPLSAKAIPLWVGNIQYPDRSRGTTITGVTTVTGGTPVSEGPIVSGETGTEDRVIKSVALSRDNGVMKIHGAGVGHRPGVLADIVGEVSRSGVNIKSVITSQTCISLLLERSDLERTHKVLEHLPTKVVERLEPLSDVALIGVVGEGVNRTKGLAGQIFGAVADADINVEMISSGASEAAYYFIVAQQDAGDAVRAIHASIFG